MKARAFFVKWISVEHDVQTVLGGLVKTTDDSWINRCDRISFHEWDTAVAIVSNILALNPGELQYKVIKCISHKYGIY